MQVIGLFSGIGGFELAAEWAGWTNVVSCEINPFGRQVLEYYWPDAYHHDDIHTLTYETIKKNHSGTNRSQPSLWEDFPANRTALPETDLGKTMIATYGRKCLESFERLSRPGLWAKTFSALLIGQEGWYSKRCRLTWKLKGTKSNRIYFQLQVSAHRTDGTEFGLLLTPTTKEEPQDLDKFKARMEKYPNGTTMPNLATQVMGLLPTPNTMDTLPPKEGAAMEKIANGARKGRSAPSNLREYVNPKSWDAYQMLPTPTVNDMKNATLPQSQTQRDSIVGSIIRILLTPNSRDEKGASGLPNQSDLNRELGITGRQLNPQFVAEMMGFPPNWLELPFQSTETNL